MTAPLVQRLSLVVDAATGSTETRMDAVAASVRETGEAAQRSAGQVAAAAERVAAAQLKRDDAADRVALAERRLSEVSEKYARDSSQVLAAEQRLESSRRQLHQATRAVEDATRDQARVQNDAAEATARLATQQERAGAGADRFGQQLGGVSDLIKGYAAFQLGDALRDSVTGFADGARGAATLATSMNATVEQGGRLSSLFSTLGLDAADLLEIQAEFAQKVGDSGRVLGEFGAEMKRNDDGTINWALTLEDALTQLQKIPDATERNRRGFALFGEEGYKQLSRLLNSGMSVEEALERIGTPFDEEDVRQAQEFDRAMADLSLTGTQLSQGLGSVLVPTLTVVGDGLNTVVDAATGAAAPFALATGAVVAWGAASRSAATEGSLLHGAIDGARERATGFREAAANAATGASTWGRGMGVAKAAGTGLLSAVGGPLGAAVLGLGVGFTVLNALTEENAADSEAAKQAQQSLTQALQESNGVITENVRQRAAKSALDAGILDVAKRAGVAEGLVTDALLDRGDAYERVMDQLYEYQQANREIDTSTGNTVVHLNEEGQATEDARAALEEKRGENSATIESEQQLQSELQETTDKQALATAATEALTAAMDSGNLSTEELTRLAHEAAVAQDAAASASDRAQAAIDAVRATTTGAAQATLEFINARYASEDAQFAFLSALDAARAAVDDDTTSVDENRQAWVRVMETSLRAATASADTAVQNAEMAGQVVTDLDEARIRADQMLASLQGSLDKLDPGPARDELQGIVDQLQAAKDRGDIQAVLTLTGAQETAGEIDEATADRDTTVNIESRGGRAVIAYLDEDVARDRLALIRTESRNGPAVKEYLNGLAEQRLAIIRVETRNGPDVERYLNGLARERTAVINLQRRESGGPAGGSGPTGTAFGAGGPSTVSSVGHQGDVHYHINVPPGGGSGGNWMRGDRRIGQEIIAHIRAAEQTNGASWRRNGG